MKAWKIVVSYLTYTAIHFGIASVLFSSKSSPGTSIIAKILSSIANTIYWVQVVGIYLLILLVSSLIGMYIYRNRKPTYRIFLGIAVGCALAIVTAIILSYF